MTERERTVGAAVVPTHVEPVYAPIEHAFVRLELRFRDGATYSRRWARDDEDAPAWRGCYAVSGPPAWATMTDPRPLHDAGAIVATELGKALVSTHGDIVQVDAIEAPN